MALDAETSPMKSNKGNLSQGYLFYSFAQRRNSPHHLSYVEVKMVLFRPPFVSWSCRPNHAGVWGLARCDNAEIGTREAFMGEMGVEIYLIGSFHPPYLPPVCFLSSFRFR